MFWGTLCCIIITHISIFSLYICEAGEVRLMLNCLKYNHAIILKTYFIGFTKFLLSAKNDAGIVSHLKCRPQLKPPRTKGDEVYCRTENGHQSVTNGYENIITHLLFKNCHCVYLTLQKLSLKHLPLLNASAWTHINKQNRVGLIPLPIQCF